MSSFQNSVPSDSPKVVARIAAEVEKKSFPLLGAQNAIFTQWRIFPESTQYNIPFFFSIPSQYSDEAFCDALATVVKTHPQLHMVFRIDEEGTPFQMITDEPINVTCQETTEAALSETLQSLIVPFDLTMGIPIRFVLIKTESNRYLFFDMHHAVTDGISHGMFIRQLERALSGQPLESEQVSFAECVAEEQERRERSLTEDLAFFDAMLSDCDSAELPETTNENSSTAGQIVRRWKNNAALEFVQTHSLSAAVLLSSSLALTLNRLSRKKKVLFAQINHGRSDRTWGQTIGEFSRSVPMAMGNEPSETVVDYLTRCKQIQRECWKHLTPSLEELTQGASVPPSFFFSFQKNANDHFVGEILAIHRLPVNDPIMPLCAEVFEFGEDWEVRFNYDTGIYDRQTIETVFDAWKQIFDAMIASPDFLCDALETISPEEKQAILTLGTGERLDFDRRTTFIRLFQEQVARHPQKTAVTAQDQTLTYAQLDAASNKLARQLKAKGAGQGKFVCVMLPRTTDFLVAVLGIFKSGSAYVPLDSEYPLDRLDYMLNDSQSEILITTQSLYEAKNTDGNFQAKHLLFLGDTQNGDTQNGDETKSFDESRPDAPAYMIYTSGSTGKPKGVVIPHRSLVAFIHNTNQLNRETDRISCFCSFSFDASVTDLFPTLALGAELYLVPESLRRDMEGLNAWFQANQITGGVFPTRFGTDFLSLFDPGLNHVIMGGETMTVFPAPTRTKVINGYGPTEFTVCSNICPMNFVKNGNVPIGRPMPNVANYVIDQTGHLLPHGFPGELCLSGEQLSLGYWQRPEITADRFIRNPWTTSQADRLMYRTGDLVRWNSKGQLEYIGRIDSQIKLRGFRIELGEIEQAIRQYDGVTEAVASVLEQGGAGQLCAWFTASAPIEPEKLRDFLAQSLTDYMVPSLLCQVSAFPVTPNGKIDRRKLSAEIPTSNTASDAASSPKSLNRLEIELTQIIAELLGRSGFGLDENLIRFGLTSLSAIRLTVLLHKRYGVTLSAPALMRHCCVTELEDKILENLLIPTSTHPVSSPAAGTSAPTATGTTATGTTATETTATETTAATTPRVSPLTAPQSGVYYEVLKNPDKTLYNIPMRYTFPQNFDADRLAATLERVFAIHPALFSHFEPRGDEIVQVFATERVPEIQRLTLDADSFKQLLSEFTRPFSPAQGPLYRAAVVQTPQSVELLLDIHHLVCDGISISILLQELSTLWNGDVSPTEERSYAEFALDEAQRRDGKSRQQAQEFFSRQLANFETATEIASDAGENAVSGTLDEVAFDADAATIETFCIQHSVTPAQLFLAGTTLAISRFTGRDDVFFSMITSGRDDVRDRNTVGMFVRTLPFAGGISRKTSALEFIRSIGETLYATMENGSYSFSELAAQYGFQPKIMYTCELGVVPEIKIGDVTPQAVPLGLDTPKFPVSIHIEQRNGVPVLAVQYDGGLYHPFRMRMLAQSLLQAVYSLTADPTQDVSTLSILSPEQNRLLERFRVSATAPLAQEILPRIFEARVSETPDRAALIACDRTLTFAQLNAESDRLAAALLHRGLQKEARVVSLLPRTSRAIIALLGIMKSGGVYVPCDPDYPTDRIRTIAGDGESRFVLTTADRVSEFGELGQDIETLLAEEPGSLALPTIEPDQLAYVIYTSGSTGKPKGVMIQHGGIANYVTPHAATPHVLAVRDQAHTLLSITTVCFDMSFKEILVALCNGVTLVFADEEQKRHPVALAELFAETKADAFNATPSQMRTLLEYPPLRVALSQCQVLMAGGEPFPDSLRNDLRRITNARLFNTYGPTEITVSSNVKELVDEAESVNIGRPILNCVEFIADSDGNELPPGAVGELLIGGNGLARGYAGDAEKTSRSFVTRFGTRVYRSGDRAQWEQNGDVTVLGRLDSQVKLRGLRIELGEVEHAASLVPGVKQTIAGLVSLDATEHLALWYISDQPIGIDAFRETLRKTLPGYMIPTAFQKMDRFPVTPNGKIDRNRLPIPKSAARTDFVPAANERESIYCAIFADVLHKPRVGALDNFFDAGGTSLLATRIIIESQKRGLKIAFRDVFAHPTPRALAALESNSDTASGSDSISDSNSDSGSSHASDSAEPNASLDVVSSFDYAKIDQLLQTNTVKAFVQEPSLPIGTILLTGATGFLGIHLLASFLEHETGTVYCLVRPQHGRSGEARLKTMLFYYFDDRYIDEIGRRIHVLHGDVTDATSLDAIDVDIDTVFNCAANVKHFSQQDDIDRVNRIGAENIVAFCRQRGCRLVHVSTTSVAGTLPPGKNLIESTLTEQTLYFGQNMDNQYVQSKFLGERAVLSAATEGLSAKIIRVGNLSARISDGEFQANFVSNSFVGRLNALTMIGKVPYSFAATPTEFSPIDTVSEAILKLATTPESCRVFHAFNPYPVYYSDIVLMLNNCDSSLEFVDEEEFRQVMSQAASDPEKAKSLVGFVAYHSADNKMPVLCPKSCQYTIQILLRLGWKWPIIPPTYMRQFIDNLIGLGFFQGQKTME